MTFRDDHDAALARAEALERELADHKKRLEEADARRADAEAERARAESRADDLLARVAVTTPVGSREREELGRRAHEQMVQNALYPGSQPAATASPPSSPTHDPEELGRLHHEQMVRTALPEGQQQLSGPVSRGVGNWLVGLVVTILLGGIFALMEAL